jgi:hypothetical protein
MAERIRLMRRALFEAHLIGHPATRENLLRDCPEAKNGCPIEEAEACLVDMSAAQRALVWAIQDGHPSIVAFLIEYTRVRVDKATEFPRGSGTSVVPREVALAYGDDRVIELTEEAYSNIRLAHIINGGVP